MADNKVEILLTAKDQASKNIDKSTKSMKKMDKASKGLGKSLSVLKTVAVAAFAGWGIGRVASDLIKVGANFEYTMSVVRGVSKATADQYERMEAIARRMGETTEWTASQAAESLKFLSMAGFSAEQGIAALPGTLDLATAGNIDLGRAADVVTNALTAMRLPVEKLQKVSDVFIGTITSSNTNMEMMAESFKYSAPLASAYGVKIEKLAGLIGMLGNAGIQGSMAGTQLSMAFVHTAKVFDKYEVSAKKADGSSKDLVDALELLEDRGASTGEVMAIFGQRSGRAALALLGQTVPALREYIKEIEKSEGATKALAEIMRNTTRGAWKEFVSAVESLKIDIFNKYKTAIVDFLKAATKWVRENKEEIITFIKDLITGIKELWELFSSFPIAVIKHFTDVNTELKNLEAQVKKTNEALVPPKSNFTEFVVFLSNWGRDIITVFKFVLKATGEVFATLVADALASIKIIGDEFYTLGKLMWEAMTLQWGKLEGTYANFAGNAEGYNKEIEANWAVMTDNISLFWTNMIDKMKARLKGEDLTPEKPVKSDEEVIAEATAKIKPVVMPVNKDAWAAMLESYIPSEDALKTAHEARLKQIEKHHTEVLAIAISQTDFKVKIAEAEAERLKAIKDEEMEYKEAKETAYAQNQFARSQAIIESEHQVMNSLRETWGLTWEEIKNGAVNAWQDIGTAISSLSTAAAGTFTDVILGVKTAREAATAFLKLILRTVVQTLIQISMQQLILSVTSNAIQAATTAATVASMAAISAAATPAAMLVSIATAGAAAVAGATAFTASMGTMLATTMGAKAASVAGGGVGMEKGGIVYPTGNRRGVGIRVAEKEPEAVVPLPDGRSIPVEMRGGAEGGTHNYFYIQAVDSKSFADVVERNPQAIIKIISDDLDSHGPLSTEMKGALL